MARAVVEPRTAVAHDPAAAFEAAWIVRGEAEMDEFLPGPGHRDRGAVALALARLDLEFRRGSRRARPAEDYLCDYPEIGKSGLDELALAEYRARIEAGERVTPADYHARLGVDTRGWPAPVTIRPWGRAADEARDRAAATVSRARLDPASVARSCPDFHIARDSGRVPGLDDWRPGPESDVTVDVLRDLHRPDPEGARPVAEGVAKLPEVGSEFLGFRLISELGRGAFGRVFLASQGDLAGRPVALKVSAEKPAESQTLARLQHTNIVPIFSAHVAGPLHAVCMPYFGSTTLKDIFEELELRQGPPTSGEDLLKSLGSRRLVAAASASVSAPASAEEATGPAGGQPAPRPCSDTIRMLGKLPYVEAVLWLGSRLADGLSHAHGRGILHRDLKPANVLLTDEGQPMLLDFNLSEDIKQPTSTASFGGTLPYMAPEHIRAFRGEAIAVDERSDLYSLGVILYELLAGRHPFGIHSGSSGTVMKLMTEDRQKAPPGLREFNPQVSRAVESIVRHCLEPDPSGRYQAAAQLHEDLERQLADLPLRHAPDPSPRERAGKWGRRHPRLTSSTTIGIAAGFLCFGIALAALGRQDRLAKLEASEALSAFRDEVPAVQFLLNTRTSDRDRRARGVEAGRAALGRYRAADGPGWVSGPLASNLPPEKLAELRAEVGEVFLYLARAGALDAADRPAGGEERAGLARAALADCDRAASCFDEGRAPRALLAQRAELLGLLGRDEEAGKLRALAEAAPLRTARDHHLLATGLLNQGEYRKALPLAEEATRIDPRDFWAWFAAGLCRERIGRDAEADACYSTCIALRPDSPYPWFNRAETLLSRDEHRRALADFDRALALDPTWAEALVERAIAEQHEGIFPRAIADLTLALELGASPARALWLRAATRERSGDAAGAARDRSEAMKADPRDDQGWVLRSLSRMAADPVGALADLDRALALNPRSVAALQNRAYLLSERLGRIEEAAKTLDRAVALYPDYVPSRSGRGVLRAILGRRDEAHQDARESLWRENSPRVLYQVAGIYAVTSRQVPEDRVEACRLLSTALRQGFGFDELADDRELDAIRDQPEFRKLLEAARALRGAPAAAAAR